MYVIMDELGALASAKFEQRRQIDRLLSMLPQKKKLLQNYYGYLLHWLRHRPPRSLSTLIIRLTDESVVSQSRVNFLVNLYLRDPRPDFELVLQTMRSHAPATVYIPPTGQTDCRAAHLPVDVVYQLLQDDVGKLSRIHTLVLRTLRDAHISRIAELLAQLVSLAHVANHILLGAEQFIYEALDRWDGKWAPFVNVLAQLLPYFKDERAKKALAHRLRKASPQAASVFLPYLADPVYQDLADNFAIKALSIQKSVGAVLFLYTMLGRPPPNLLDILVHYPALIPICEKWATYVPRLCRTLQGSFALDCPVAEVIGCSQEAIDESFALPNCPWLGPARTVARSYFNMPPIITAEAEGYKEYCASVVEYMAKLGLSIDEYLYPT